MITNYLNKHAYYFKTGLHFFSHIYPLWEVFPAPVITENKETYEILKNKYPQVELHYHPNVWQTVIFLIKQRRKFIIYPHYYRLPYGKAIQLYHGAVDDKSFDEKSYIRGFDFVLIPGQKLLDKYKITGNLKGVKWKLTGYVKSDNYLKNKNIKIKHYFKNDKKTILYAPTWEGRMLQSNEINPSSLKEYAIPIIKAIDGKYNLIIKPHFDTFHLLSDIEKFISSWPRKNVLLLKEDDILKPMMEADLLISDFSSVSYDWMLFDRPLIFINQHNLKPSDNIMDNTYLWQAGQVVSDINELMPAIEKNLKSDPFSKIRKQIIEYSMFKPDGKSCIRTRDAIIEYIRDQGWLKNIIRKIKAAIKK